MNLSLYKHECTGKFYPLLLIAITLLIFICNTPICSANTHTLEGIIKDRDGDPLQNVQITVIDTVTTSISGAMEGIVKGTYKSGSRGTFNINVSLSDSIIFSKKGYVSKRINFINSFVAKVDLGTIILEKGLTITSTSQNQLISPGSKLQIPLELKNRGEYEETCNITTLTPPGWVIQLTNDKGKFNQLILPNSTVINFNVEVYIPINATGTNTVSLIFKGYTELTWTLKVTVTDTQTDFLWCQYPSKTAEQGDTVRYHLSLYNSLFSEERFKLSVECSSSDLECWISNLDGEKINEIVLGPESENEFYVELYIPKKTFLKEFHVVVRAEKHGLMDGLELVTTIEESTKKLELWTNYPTQSVNLGDKVIFEVNIKNPGRTVEVIDLSSGRLPEDWTIFYKNSGGVEIQQVSLPGGGEDQVFVEIKPSLLTEPGNYPVILHAGSPNIDGNITLTIGLSCFHKLRLSLADMFKQVDIGETKTISAKVFNEGFSPVNNLELVALSNSASIEVDVSPVKVPVLRPNESQEFQINVRSLEGTAPGDYYLRVAVESDEYSILGDENSVRLSVGQGSSLTLTAGALFAVSLAVVYVVMKKFRRR